MDFAQPATHLVVVVIAPELREVKTVKDGGIVEWVKEAPAPAPAAATNGKSPAKSADTPKKEDPKSYKKTKINEE